MLLSKEQRRFNSQVKTIREADAEAWKEKTTIMQKITTANEADELLRLLEMQLTLLDGRKNVFAE